MYEERHEVNVFPKDCTIIITKRVTGLMDYQYFIPIYYYLGESIVLTLLINRLIYLLLLT